MLTSVGSPAAAFDADVLDVDAAAWVGVNVTKSRAGYGRVAGTKVGMEVRSTFGATPRQEGVYPQLETTKKLTHTTMVPIKAINAP